LLTDGSLDALRFGTPGALSSILEVVYDPIVNWAVATLPPWAIFVIGLGVLLAAFNIFDRALPEIDPQRTGFERIADMVYRPFVMFLLGLAVTTLTLSVSVSLTMLVPLSAKGYVRRENLIPYIMGANISTFVDTLFASLLVNHPRAFTIVLVEMISVGFISLLIMALFYPAYQRRMESALERILRSNRSLAIFLGSLLLIPLILLLFRP
jgi:Na+/phosphate symporter